MTHWVRHDSQPSWYESRDGRFRIRPEYGSRLWNLSERDVEGFFVLREPCTFEAVADAEAEAEARENRAEAEQPLRETENR